MNFFDEVGGHQTFDRLVSAFYQGVKNDPLLSPMYPEGDFAGAEDRLRTFLEQYWGGPHTYSENRGHPRLRMRHAPFPIDEAARDAWLKHFRAAMDTCEFTAEQDAQLWAYAQQAANAMINTPTLER